MKPLFSNLERLEIVSCKMKASFATEIIAITSNIKHFFLHENSLKIKIRTEWLFQKYPTLNHFGVVSYLRALPITSFLELNPNVRWFETNSANIWENRDSLRASKVALDDLAVQVDCKEYYEKFADHREITMLASICHLLNELHELGIYKRLRLCVKYDLKQETIDEIASLNALVKFEVGTLLLNPKDNFAMSALRNIEELHVQKSTEINDIGATADNLVNLKLLYMNEADINSIMPFIRRARKMEMIKIDHPHQY